MKKIKIHNLDNLPTCNLNDFIELQEDFKKKSISRNIKLQNRIIESGFKYPVFCWENEGKKYIIDAHSRIQALRQLKEQGHEIPKIPYIRVQAKDLNEAKKEILYLNSQYSEIDFDSNFLKDNLDREFDTNIEFGTNLPDIEFGKIEKKTEQLKPYSKSHILISFNPDRFAEISSIIQKLYELDYIEIEQSSN
jgi:hypothetical protein